MEAKSIFDNLESISIFKDASKFGYEHWYKPETMLIAGNWGNRTSPIAYIHKPKSVSIEDWNRFKEKLEITLLK
jgi:Fe-S cluster biosynthesis and repair protein YggX